MATLQKAPTKPYVPPEKEGASDVYVLDLSKTAALEAKAELAAHTYVYPFYISCRSEVNPDVVYDGVFVCKRLTFADVAEVQRRKVQICGAVPTDAMPLILENISYILAYLDVALVRTPDWWKNNPLIQHEHALYRGVYEVAHTWELNFCKRVLERWTSKITTDSSSTDKDGPG